VVTYIMKRSDAAPDSHLPETWDDIVTQACLAVDDMLLEGEYDYGVYNCSDWPELRDIIETAILKVITSSSDGTPRHDRTLYRLWHGRYHRQGCAV